MPIKGEKVCVQDVQIEDDTGMLRVSMWRGGIQSSPQPGNKVLLKDAPEQQNNDPLGIR